MITLPRVHSRGCWLSIYLEADPRATGTPETGDPRPGRVLLASSRCGERIEHARHRRSSRLSHNVWIDTLHFRRLWHVGVAPGCKVYTRRPGDRSLWVGKPDVQFRD